jgi:hypothetical protein
MRLNMSNKSVSTSTAMLEILKSLNSTSAPQINTVITSFSKTIQLLKVTKKSKVDENLNKTFEIKRINYKVIAKLSNPVGDKNQKVYTATVLDTLDNNSPFNIGDTFPISINEMKYCCRPINQKVKNVN